MPSSASISTSASPEIARFGGMVFHVFYDDHIEPHVEVMVKGTKLRFSLLNGNSHAEVVAKGRRPIA